ncbi:hypothetical protein AB0A63_07505 [Lentzea sp. NPDC042327]|uniref:hypothetical protein n=1 Tax=Lentzea sp. NPDC042327 TaxID=3154801 RepID=UPI0033F64920
MAMSRRQALVNAGRGAAVLAVGSPALTACGAAKPMLAGAAGAWLAELGDAIKADIAAKAVEKGKLAFEELWKKWEKPTSDMKTKQVAEGFAYFGTTIYGHAVPGTTLVSVHRVRQVDPATDRLACVRESGEHVVLESWAWKGMLAFIKHELEGKEGDDKLHALQLLAMTLMPHGAVLPGTTPAGSVSWVSYPARDGAVEIVKFSDGGKDKVGVTASGYFSGDHGKATKLTFDLA